MVVLDDNQERSLRSLAGLKPGQYITIALLPSTGSAKNAERAGLLSVVPTGLNPNAYDSHDGFAKPANLVPGYVQRSLRDSRRKTSGLPKAGRPELQESKV
jgi:hypothetical protein